MIVISGHDHLTGVAKHLNQAKINICTLTPEMNRHLNNLDIPSKALGEASKGLEGLANQYATGTLVAVATTEFENGLEPGGQKFINTQLPQYLYPRLADLALLALTIDRTKPKLVILHNDVEPINRLAALWAKTNEVPCLHIPHAIYQDINRGPVGTDIHDLITASHLASAGPKQTEWYKKRGFEPDNIRETGIPLFEHWESFNMTKAKCQQLLGVDSGKPVVMYASTWPQHTNRQGINEEWIDTYQAVLKFALKNDIELIVKCHPGGGEPGMNFHIEEANKAGVKCTVVVHHLAQCIKASDLVIAYGSNVIIDAAFCNSRLVAVKGYEKDNEVLNATPKTVGQKITDALNSPIPDCEGFLKKWTVRGDVSKRIADYALELLG